MDGDSVSGRREAAKAAAAATAAENQSFSYFGPRQARLLSKLLTHTHLPGLTSLDQMHLLALADTVSTCELDLAERFAIDAARKAISKESTDSGGGAAGLATNSIFFLFPFCEKSLICLEGKSMTPHQGNTILFLSSQQLPRHGLNPLKGF